MGFFDNLKKAFAKPKAPKKNKAEELHEREATAELAKIGLHKPTQQTDENRPPSSVQLQKQADEKMAAMMAQEDAKWEARAAADREARLRRHREGGDIDEFVRAEEQVANEHERVAEFDANRREAAKTAPASESEPRRAARL